MGLPKEAKDKAKDKAEERTSLSRAELWLLRISAFTGIASFISHGADALSKLLNLFK